ncbi:deoxyguanosinetriphosphate triphosphohydrolase [Candidatus Symbiothrix dinenymphae]|nr:deoxyguanosinetriphosphate triphosphohydrolase [Candidatus Symbiothrix dinenymphae]
MDWNKLLNSGRLRQSNRADKGNSARNDFESDFGRIIFSPAIRRLHDKAQVFPLTTDDNIHSRLTHSMETMSVGYSMGVKISESAVLKKKTNKETYDLFREIPIIIKNCCLVHDIGNPPFGHFGETVIQNYFKDYFEKMKNNDPLYGLTEKQKNDFEYFDGNAQGLRVLSKLQILNDPYGLNLTYATLASYMKYPHCGVPDKMHIETKKHGVFLSEKEYFDTIVENCGLKEDNRIVRHPLSYIIEAADSICYLVMDIEDGYNKKLFDIDYLYDKYKDIPCIKEKIDKIYNDEGKYYKNNNTKTTALISKSIIKSALEENNLNSDDGKKGLNDLEPYYKLKVIVDFISGMTDQYALNHYQRISGQKIS